MNSFTAITARASFWLLLITKYIQFWNLHPLCISNYNFSTYLNKHNNIHTFLCELFEQVGNNMVQGSTASSTNHCICDKTKRNWFSLLYKDSLIQSNKNPLLIWDPTIIYCIHLLAICEWLYFSQCCYMIYSITFMNCVQDEPGTFSIILVSFAIRLMTGVLRCVRGWVRRIFKTL